MQLASSTHLFHLGSGSWWDWLGQFKGAEVGSGFFLLSYTDLVVLHILQHMEDVPCSVDALSVPLLEREHLQQKLVMWPSLPLGAVQDSPVYLLPCQHFS